MNVLSEIFCDAYQLLKIGLNHFNSTNLSDIDCRSFTDLWLHPFANRIHPFTNQLLLRKYFISQRQQIIVMDSGRSFYFTEW